MLRQDVWLGCCLAYLLLHFSEQKIRLRPRPVLAGMAMPQFGQKPITLIFPVNASSNMLHLTVFARRVHTPAIWRVPMAPKTVNRLSHSGVTYRRYQAIVRYKSPKPRFCSFWHLKTHRSGKPIIEHLFHCQIVPGTRSRRGFHHPRSFSRRGVKDL